MAGPSCSSSEVSSVSASTSGLEYELAIELHGLRDAEGFRAVDLIWHQLQKK